MLEKFAGWDDAIKAPIAYHHSGHRPDPTERQGVVEVGGIPGHICEQDEDAYCPYLRLGIMEDELSGKEQTVVLDREQVESLRDTLTEWLERVVEKGCIE